MNDLLGACIDAANQAERSDILDLLRRPPRRHVNDPFLRGGGVLM
jgi:hypothetical protein